MQAFFLIGSTYARSRTAASRLEQPRLRLAAVVDGLLAFPIARTLRLLGIAGGGSCCVLLACPLLPE